MCAIKQCHIRQRIPKLYVYHTKSALRPGALTYGIYFDVLDATPYIRPDINRRHKLCTGRSFIVALVTTS